MKLLASSLLLALQGALASEVPTEETAVSRDLRGGRPQGPPDDRVPLLDINMGPYRPGGQVRGPGDTIYVARLWWGGVQKINVFTGMSETVVPDFGFTERASAGMAIYRGALLMMCAGPTPPWTCTAGIFVYDPERYYGDDYEMLACTDLPDLPAPYTWGFLNDIDVVGDTAYATESFHNYLLTMDLKAAVRPNKRECVLDTLEVLPDPTDSRLNGLEFITDRAANPMNFRGKTNGLVPYGNGFIMGSTEGGNYWYSLEDGYYYFLEDETISNHDQVYRGGKLYSTDTSFPNDVLYVWDVEWQGANTPPILSNYQVEVPTLLETGDNMNFWNDYLYIGNLWAQICFFCEGEIFPETWDEVFNVFRYDGLVEAGGSLGTVPIEEQGEVSRPIGNGGGK